MSLRTTAQETAEDEDSDLPPRPQGCSGDCQPGDQYDPDAVPCPHCTAKQFKEQMQDEGKQNLPEEEMEQEMQDFLDNWQKEADKDGNEGDLEDVRGSDGKTTPSRPGGAAPGAPRGAAREPRPTWTTRICLRAPRAATATASPATIRTASPARTARPSSSATRCRRSARRSTKVRPSYRGGIVRDVAELPRRLGEGEARGAARRAEGEQNPEEIDEDPPEEELKDGEEQEADICDHCGRRQICEESGIDEDPPEEELSGPARRTPRRRSTRTTKTRTKRRRSSSGSPRT